MDRLFGRLLQAISSKVNTHLDTKSGSISALSVFLCMSDHWKMDGYQNSKNVHEIHLM